MVPVDHSSCIKQTINMTGTIAIRQYAAKQSPKSGNERKAKSVDINQLTRTQEQLENK
jgi:hypothetical protein